MDKVIDYYSCFDEWGRLDREPLEFVINSYYIRQHLPLQAEILDNGAGPGKYAMNLASRGHRVTLTDLTPRLVELAKQKSAELNLSEQFAGYHVMNAIQLEGLSDNEFDASLMMGPMYHLQHEKDRTAALRELHRVTRPGGTVFVAFQSRMRMTITSLQYPQYWKPHDRMEALDEFQRTGVFNHQDPGRFTGAYYVNLDEIKPMMEQAGFETLELIASSSIGNLLTAEQKQYWEERGEGDALLELLIEKAKDPSILGVSSHLLYIGRRI